MYLFIMIVVKLLLNLLMEIWLFFGVFFFNWINCMFFFLGFMLVVGIILYIFVINDEVGYWLKFFEVDEDIKKFDYEYGWLFFFVGIFFFFIMIIVVILVLFYL